MLQEFWQDANQHKFRRPDTARLIGKEKIYPFRAVILTISRELQIKEKINILHLIGELPLGGAENLLLVLARNIDRTRFNLSFCCLRRGGYIADRLKEEGFKVVCLDNYRMRHFYKKIRNIVGLINAECPDIVQTHLIEANLLGRICALFLRVPVVCKTEHAFLSRLWVNPTFKQRAYLFIDRILDKCSDCIIYVSDAQRRIINMGKYNPLRHIVIYNAFDGKRFSIDKPKEGIRRLYGFSPKDIVIGTVGRLVPHKGHDYLFEAVKKVRKKYDRVKIIVVGSGPEEERLKRSVKTLGIDVLFLSERKDVPELMKAMDIYVQPSFWETFGLTIAEAMSSGLPVVATNVGGIPEVVLDGETGILVKPEDSDAIADALLRLIENPDLAQKMGEKGRDVAFSKFSGQRYAKDMERLYTSLIEERKTRRFQRKESGASATIKGKRWLK